MKSKKFHIVENPIKKKPVETGKTDTQTHIHDC